jgi:3',5'-cyclic AMP phosphodiesterase CpdA
LLIFIVASCTKDQDSLADKSIKIAVVPDIHYTHPSLLPDDIEDSPSLMTYLGLYRKLLEISDPIFRKVLSELIAEKPDILLVPGDLTKDGELIGQEVVEDLLQDLENKGIKVFVVPGNNDILNPDAFSFTTEPPVPVNSITPEQFAEIYGNFGYGEARYRDNNSLSYICEPYTNLWIL